MTDRDMLIKLNRMASAQLSHGRSEVAPFAREVFAACEDQLGSYEPLTRGEKAVIVGFFLSVLCVLWTIWCIFSSLLNLVVK